MTGRVKHIFIFICIFSLFSLTVQASVISLCKESKVFKNQSQSNPVSEEEEESHDGDEEVDELFYMMHRDGFIDKNNLEQIRWSTTEKDYLSCTKKITIPPPKF
ncbi:MAG: hypothetical protein V4565_03775 [Bacteroidota bacterium]